MITMIGASYCGPCKTVKAQLEKAGVKFRYLDLSNDADAEHAAKLGARPSIPQVIVETQWGRLYLGPDAREIMKGIREFA